MYDANSEEQRAFFKLVEQLREKDDIEERRNSPALQGLRFLYAARSASSAAGQPSENEDQHVPQKGKCMYTSPLSVRISADTLLRPPCLFSCFCSSLKPPGGRELVTVSESRKNSEPHQCFLKKQRFEGEWRDEGRRPKRNQRPITSAPSVLSTHPNGGVPMSSRRCTCLASCTCSSWSVEEM